MITDYINLDQSKTRIDFWGTAEAIHAAGLKKSNFPELLTPADTIRENIFPLYVGGLEIYAEDIQTIFENLDIIEAE